MYKGKVKFKKVRIYIFYDQVNLEPLLLPLIYDQVFDSTILESRILMSFFYSF